MKKRNNIVLSVAIVLSFIFFYFYNYSYVVFEPVFFDSSFEKRLDVSVDSAFYPRLKLVLEKYGFKYKIDPSGKVLVQRKLSRDKELMYNFTTKSMDSTWIKKHLELED